VELVQLEVEAEAAVQRHRCSRYYRGRRPFACSTAMCDDALLRRPPFLCNKDHDGRVAGLMLGTLDPCFDPVLSLDSCGQSPT
jgi:hypothetical protein